MAEKGRVRDIRGKIIHLTLQTSDACFGCMKTECKGSVLRAENKKGLQLEVGQTVELKSPETPILGQAAAAVLPPVLGFITGFFLTTFLFPEAGEAAAPFTGIILLFASAFIVYRLRKKHPIKEYLPSVERIIE